MSWACRRRSLPLLVALVLLAAYRFWKRPGWRTAIVARGFDRNRRPGSGRAGAARPVHPGPAGAVATAWRGAAGPPAGARHPGRAGRGGAPWVGYNLSRFKDPVFISCGLGVTLASANCPATYSGAFEGYWHWECALRAPVDQNVDESVQGSEAQTTPCRSSSGPIRTGSFPSRPPVWAGPSASSTRSSRCASTPPSRPDLIIGRSPDCGCTTPWSPFDRRARVLLRRRQFPSPRCGRRAHGRRLGYHHLRDDQIPQPVRGLARPARCRHARLDLDPAARPADDHGSDPLVTPLAGLAGPPARYPTPSGRPGGDEPAPTALPAPAGARRADERMDVDTDVLVVVPALQRGVLGRRGGGRGARSRRPRSHVLVVDDALHRRHRDRGPPGRGRTW